MQIYCYPVIINGTPIPTDQEHICERPVTYTEYLNTVLKKYIFIHNFFF